jgi:hypothetical protein
LLGLRVLAVFPVFKWHRESGASALLPHRSRVSLLMNVWIITPPFFLSLSLSHCELLFECQILNANDTTQVFLCLRMYAFDNVKQYCLLLSRWWNVPSPLLTDTWRLNHWTKGGSKDVAASNCQDNFNFAYLNVSWSYELKYCYTGLYLTQSISVYYYPFIFLGIFLVTVSHVLFQRKLSSVVKTWQWNHCTWISRLPHLSFVTFESFIFNFYN